jgi:trimeric autotransporter adhesin
MKFNGFVLVFLVMPFLLTAQSVLITPGAHSINGDSSSQDQLNVYGNGLLVSPKVKFTDVEPSSFVRTMHCLPGYGYYEASHAGTLIDPSGDKEYLIGENYDCDFSFRLLNDLFIAYQIDFEMLDTEADGDTVFILDYYNSSVIAAYSGNTLPSSLITSSFGIKIKFKTDGDANVGEGFVLKWRAILREETQESVKDYIGLGLIYDASRHALWTGRHSPKAFKSRGYNSVAFGNNTAASGGNSMAIGYSTNATGYNSTAIGEYSAATGTNSTAIGQNVWASGLAATALGQSTWASGLYSTALGSSTYAKGESSVAMGHATISSGDASSAMGYYTKASGFASTAMGYNTTASGQGSTAIGCMATTKGFAGPWF